MCGGFCTDCALHGEEFGFCFRLEGGGFGVWGGTVEFVDDGTGFVVPVLLNEPTLTHHNHQHQSPQLLRHAIGGFSKGTYRTERQELYPHKKNKRRNQLQSQRNPPLSIISGSEELTPVSNPICSYESYADHLLCEAYYEPSDLWRCDFGVVQRDYHAQNSEI